MKYLIIVAGIMITLLAGCKQSDLHSNNISRKDSIIQRYLFETNAIDGYDTTDLNYQILKAYFNDDSGKLAEISKLVHSQEAGREEQRRRDSFLHIVPLKQLNAEEAYRFDYWEAFCYNQVNITIFKTADSICLYFLRYSPRYKGGYTILREANRLISQVEWDKFLKLIRVSDFWGLKATNDVMGLDGDGLTVIGCKRNNWTASNIMKYNRVYRWSVWSSTLSDPYYYLLKLSGGNKDTCTNGL